MPIPFDGFCGPSYQLDNQYAGVERLVNWLCSPIEYPEEKKTRTELLPLPCNQPFGVLPVPTNQNQGGTHYNFAQPCRGMLECRGVLYGVNGNAVWSMDQNGNYTGIGMVNSDNLPCSMVANGNGQIFIASAGQGYVIPAGGGANSLIIIPTDPVNGPFFGASFATFQDGYILVVTPNSNQFQISGTDDVPVGDATQWQADNVSIQAGQADYLQAIISSREYLRLLGFQRSQIYYDAGPQGLGAFPFISYNETFIETGIAAPFSLQDLGDSLVWIGQDRRGIRAAWRDAGFQPQRISTFAVEQRWQAYPTLADAVSFSFIWKGHLLWQITFPTAGKTWLYDDTASRLMGRQIWSEAQFLNATNQLVARPELYHAFCYGLHLVGSSGADANPGAIYQYQSGPNYTDMAVRNGELVQVCHVFDRILPNLWNLGNRVIYNRIRFELKLGVGLGSAQRPPVILLRWSDDNGNTWGREFQIPIGGQGQYSQIVYLNRLGYARNRVFWVRCSDATYWAFAGADLDMIGCSS